MAVDTMVQVIAPGAGESVTEGTILEWAVEEGGRVELDATIVEISTDKVDVEVPSPVAGTVVKRYFEEGDTVTVGAVLADVQPDDGAAPTQPDAPEADPDPAPAAVSDGAPSGAGETLDIVTPGAGESITEGTLLEWSVEVGQEVEADDTICEISTDKVDVELPAPAKGTITELLAAEGDTVTVGQVIARMTTGAGASTGTSDAAPNGNGAAAPAQAA
ncbi:MAG: 2-oxoglutarate dehydrogenase, subunit, partial [Solirubrobacterales bacterium]|nr:2-oxoglutarate dehydrogenase, subunit [Solirubrobacterales bacterium]